MEQDMKTKSWANSLASLVVVGILSTIASAQQVNSTYGAPAAVSMTLESGWTFYPATSGREVVGFLAVLPPELSGQSEFSVFWYERGEAGRYTVSAWSGWDTHEAVSLLETFYGPSLFRSSRLYTGGEEGLSEDGRFIPLTKAMGIVDPARVILDPPFPSSGATDGPGKVGGNTSDAGGGVPTCTWQDLLDHDRRMVEVTLFGEASAPSAPRSECASCEAKWVTHDYPPTSQTYAFSEQKPSGSCFYWGGTQEVPYRDCWQNKDCALTNCSEVKTRTDPIPDKTCPGSVGTSCPSQPAC